ISISDPKVLKSFVRLVYIFALLFCLCSVVPWMIVSATGVIVGQSIPVPSFVWLILAFICLITLSCCGQVRFRYPCNIILAVFTVLLITLCGSYYMFLINIWILLVALLASGSFVVLLNICGAKCPLKMLPNDFWASIFMATCVILLFALGVFMFFLRRPILSLLIALVLIFLVMNMGLYQSQYIHGRRNIIPLGDAPACALGIYSNFIVILICFSAFYYFYCYFEN
ncbi:hypothetical protein KR084_002018, partial [Drosophila pseudotakahashii]